MAWEDKDTLCEHCGAVTVRAKGITKQNMKKLFSINFTFNEVLITFMIIMVLVLAYAYKNETQACRDWIKPLYAGDVNDCKDVCNVKCERIRATEYTNFNATQNITYVNTNGFNGITP